MRLQSHTKQTQPDQTLFDGNFQVDVVGIVLLLVYWLLPYAVPDVPPGLMHICYVLGAIAVVVGVILLLFGRFRGPVGGRRHWY